jgi:glycosyltransferase involved in cell wall biosynthesis
MSQFIGEALQSAFAQTFRDFEVVVVNDGSTDASDLEKAIEPYRSGLIYIQQENRGCAAARNTGIAAATGELIALLDADEAWCPDFLARQVPPFAADPELAAFWCDGIVVGEGPLVGRRVMEYDPSVRPVTTEALLRGKVNPLTSGIVLRRQAVLDVGGFDERFQRAEDFDLYLRLCHAGWKLDFQTVVLHRRRLHSRSLSYDKLNQLSSGMDVLRKFSASVGESHRLQATIQGCLRALQSEHSLECGRLHLRAGDYERAAEDYWRAYKYRKQFLLPAFVVVLKTCPRLACRVRALRQRFLVSRAKS